MGPQSRSFRLSSLMYELRKEGYPILGPRSLGEVFALFSPSRAL
jgi:hypothetical protein